ncbi:ABC transporter permease [Blautia schinkii]|nr:ABC transporter permease [Blautia schinkii]
MKSYLSLVPVSAAVHKRQSRMTRICIILAVFLVTSIFSMTEMWLRAEQTSLIKKHGDYHIILQDVPGDKAEQIIQRNDVAVSSEYRAINSEGKESYYINSIEAKNNKNAANDKATVNHENTVNDENTANDETTVNDKYTANDENTIHGNSATLYGVEESYLSDIRNYPSEGSYPENDKQIALSADAKELFGVHTGDTVTLNTPSGDFDFTVSGFYEDDTEFNQIIDGCCAYMNLSALQTISTLNGIEVSPKYYIQFTEKTNVKKAIADIKEQYGLADENIDENTAVLGLTGASSNEMVKNIYPMAIACFVLILISGILMISSCMNSNVAQRTSFFGLMRCIGASKQQIVRFVRLEALNWCKTSIPVGCVLGIVICWILCAILRFVVKGEWVDMPLFGVSISGIVFGIAVGLITVFIAAHAPAKQAAKVSPIAAVSGNAEAFTNVTHAANTRLFKVETSLGIYHAKASKKNLFLMTGSFALTIILFLSFSACLDIVHKLLPSESNFSPDIGITSETNTNSIDPGLCAQISEIPGVKNVLGTMYQIKIPAEINGTETDIDLMSYDEFMLQNTKKSVASGDLSKVYGDSDYALTIYSESSRINVGDKVKIGDHELEIGCVASEGIGSISGSAVVVCSEETFTRITGEQKYLLVNIILDKNATEATVNKISSLAGDHLFTDRREDNSTVHGSYWTFRLAAYSFLAIISLITVLNIMNSISMGVSARIKQYGAMRAVGMESRQVTKMITAEAMTYAFCGTFAGIAAGLLLHYLIYVKIIVTHFGGTWHIPFASIGIVLLLVTVSCIIAVKAPAKRIRNMAITETINEL